MNVVCETSEACICSHYTAYQWMSVSVSLRLDVLLCIKTKLSMF